MKKSNKKDEGLPLKLLQVYAVLLYRRPVPLPRSALPPSPFVAVALQCSRR